MRFPGPQPRDDDRLTVQYRRIFALMRDGAWRTLDDISRSTGDPAASVSAQLRHMRKPAFGSHVVEKQHIEHGLWQYRLLVNEPAPKQLTFV